MKPPMTRMVQKRKPRWRTGKCATNHLRVSSYRPSDELGLNKILRNPDKRSKALDVFHVLSLVSQLKKYFGRKLTSAITTREDWALE